MKQFRQGDILLNQINKIEGNKIGTGKRILAYGEKTGHSHVLDGDVTYYNNGNGQILCQITCKSELIHDEHVSIDIPEGIYEIIRQREFDLIEGVRQVSD